MIRASDRVVSNSWRDDDYDVDDLFDVIVLSGVSAYASRTLGSTSAAERRRPAEQCVFVDDLGGNLKPAKALGMATIRHVERLRRSPTQTSTSACPPS